MSITLRNKSKQIKTYNLHRAVVGIGLKPKAITQFGVATNAKGDKAITPRPRTVPAVLTLLPGETRADLPDSVLKTTAIAREIKDPRSGLVLVKQKGPKSAPVVASASTTTTTTSKKRKSKRARSR